MIYSSNILEREPGGPVTVHLPQDYGVTAGYHTLCGLCDVPETIEDTEEPVDCRICMAVMGHVLRLAAARGVIRSCPKQATLERARRNEET